MRLVATLVASTLLLQAASDHSGELEIIRAWAVHYTQDLPDYTCDQVTTRTTVPTVRREAGRNRRVDTIEEQVSFVDHKEIYEVRRINGKPTEKEHGQLDGISSDGEFGSIIDNTFDPESGAMFRWEGRHTRDGRRVNEFSFHVPAEHGYGIVQNAHGITVAYEGWVYADAHTGEIVRLEMNCVGIPRQFFYERVDLALDLKPTMVAGRRYMLPSHHHLHSRTNTTDYTNEAEYKSCRRFEVRSTVKFEDLGK